jgi:hypothetical protein
MFDADMLREEIERGFEIGEPTSMAYAVTGERYVTIGHQCDGKSSQPCTVDEGMNRELGFDEETAYWSAIGGLSAICRGQDRKVVLALCALP